MQPTIDPGYLQYVSGGDPAFELELLSVFVEDTDKHLVQLVAIVEADPATLASANVQDSIRREAHYIKGASHNIGALRMAHLAAQLEAQAAPEQREDLSHAVDVLVTEFEQVKQVQALRFQAMSVAGTTHPHGSQVN